MAIGKLDVDRHAGGNRGCRAQRPARSIAYQRKTPCQYAPIRERREQLGIALTTRPARIQQIVHGASGARGEHANTLALLRNPGPMHIDIRGGAGPQPQRNSGITFTAALHMHAQQVRAQPAADAREAHAMDVGVGAQCTR